MQYFVCRPVNRDIWTSWGGRHTLRFDRFDFAFCQVCSSMLKRLQLKRFKSFVDEQIEFAPLTICVGANASGKSNLFDAIRFLQGVGTGWMIREILEGVWQGGKKIRTPIRGGIKEVAYHDSQQFQLDSSWGYENEGTFTDHRIRCKTAPRMLVAEEHLKAKTAGKYIFDTEAGALGEATGLNDSEGLRVAVKRRGRGRSPTTTVSAHRSVLDQLEPMNGMHSFVLPVVNRFKDLLQSSTFLDITPGRMRDYVSKQVEQIGAEGENLSGILWQLTNQDEENERDIVDWLAELCSQEFIGVDFVETDLGDVMLEVIERGGQSVSARSLSDGTLRFLGLIVAILTADRDSVLLLEEIENGLHPSRVHLLVELLEELTSKRGVQVIATTHSPLVLKSLSDRSLRDVLLFARHRNGTEPTGTVVRRLQDVPHFEEVIEKKPIDELFTSRWLEHALWMS